MKYDVSVLVPVYNVSDFIERCAISLFEQSFEDIEYIFVNDCTPDDSIEVLEGVLQRYPNRKERVKIIHHQHNKGLAGARNTAVSSATGDYVLHIDSDDYVEINMVELLYNKAIEDNADVVVCDFISEWETSKRVEKQVYSTSPREFINQMLSVEAFPSVWNKLFRRELYTQHNIAAIEGVNLGEDFVTTPRLVYFANKISKVEKTLYHYMQTNANSYTRNHSKKNIDNLICVLQELTHFFEGKQDYSSYQDALLQGKLRKKMDMLFFADEDYVPYLMSLFPETGAIKDRGFLSKRDKISVFLLDRKWMKVFWVYRIFYKWAYKVKFFIKNKLNVRLVS